MMLSLLKKRITNSNPFKFYKMTYKKKTSINKKFTEAFLERDGRESNPQLPA